jgi:cell division cycle protein 37
LQHGSRRSKHTGNFPQRHRGHLPTYNQSRGISKAKKAEAGAAGEQIQLVTENPDTVISFNVPDGPPPENLVLEGPGTEGMDVEDVRKALQVR